MKKLLIAETAWHHQGDEKFMLDLVEHLCVSRADCIKIHISLDIDEYMHPDHPSYNKAKEMLLSERCWEKVTQKVISSGKELIALCNDKKSIEFALAHETTALELHAVAVHDVHLLKYLAENAFCAGKAMLIGVGAIPIEEVDALYQRYAQNLVLMFGIQNYPTIPGHVDLAKQRRLMNLFPKSSYGYADHTEWNHPDNILISLLGGMDKTYLEKHATHRPGEKRLDYEAAISIEQLDQLRRWLDLAELVEGDGLLVQNEGENQYSRIGPMRRAMIATRNFQSGEKLDWDYICFKRTAQVSDLLPIMLGKVGRYRFTRNVSVGSIITREMLKIDD